MVAPALVTDVAVSVREFRKRYGSLDAVSGVSFEVRRGEVFGLIGPDGAGKSSILKAVAGVLAFDSGGVDVLSTRIDSEKAAERVKARIGFMPQGLGQNLYPELSVEENVDFFARLRGVSAAALARQKRRLLEVTHLAPFRDRPMKQLSGGMKQKLGLVCTLVHEPELVILDEPTTGVDPVSRRDFWEILGDLLHEVSGTALVSTAYLDEASRFHRVALVFDGKILDTGAPDEIVARALGSSSGDLEDVFVSLVEKRPRAAVEASPARSTATPPFERVRGDGPPAIEAAGLTRDFGAFRAVDGVSFRVRRGEIFGLLGANGAGKTTVIKMLTGILPPSSGAGSVAGVDMRRAGISIKRRIGYVSQAFSLYTDLTVSENLALYAGIYGLRASEARDRIRSVVEVGGLGPHVDRPARALPMGMRQRLALACALVHAPEVLFLDEPTSGVDPLGRRQFWEILRALARDEGVAILVTTHTMPEAERCDRLALMFRGRIVADAPPGVLEAEVERDAGSPFEISVDRPELALSVLRRAGAKHPALFGSKVRVFCRRAEAELAEVTGALERAGVAVHATVRKPVSMEDVFVFRVTELERGGAMPP